MKRPLTMRRANNANSAAFRLLAIDVADEAIFVQERLVGRRSVGGIGPHPARRVALVEQALAQTTTLIGSRICGRPSADEAETDATSGLPNGTARDGARVFVEPLISQQRAGVDVQPDEIGIGLFAGAHERLYESGTKLRAKQAAATRRLQSKGTRLTVFHCRVRSVEASK